MLQENCFCLPQCLHLFVLPVCNLETLENAWISSQD